MRSNGFTPTQQRIMNILRDGLPHHWKEMTACVDELADRNNLKPHLTALRKIIGPRGLDIVCGRRGHMIYYRLFRIVSAD